MWDQCNFILTDSSFIIFNRLYIAPIFLGSEVHYHDKAF